MIQVEDVFVVFYSGTPLERVALRGINFTVKEGELVALLGNNGCGRSTLLKFMAGYIVASFGRMKVNGIDVTSQKLSQRSKIFSSVFYNHEVSTASHLTVAENLAIASMHHQDKSMFRAALDEETKEMYYEQLKELNFMNMERFLDTEVCDISTVHKHVLSILIAVIKEAKVLLIDEHSTGLDRDSSAALMNVTEKIVRSKKVTTIIAVNDHQSAMNMSDHLLVLNHGEVVANIDSEAKKNIKISDLYESFNMIPLIRHDMPPLSR